MSELLRIEDLHTQFHVHGGTVKAVDGVNLTIPAKATVGLVGESGSGKSITALSIMRLLEKNGRITAGHVWFRDRDLVGLTEEEMRDVRGNDVSMIFQEPMTALNPVYTCGDQIAEAVRLHEKVEPKAAFERAIEVLRLVGISDPKRRARQYPHELSGGMRQRVMIAMALSTNPEL
ncbi:MAG: ABC transporter ATP-binding protein, partial [Chloroflexi bacterium]